MTWIDWLQLAATGGGFACLAWWLSFVFAPEKEGQRGLLPLLLGSAIFLGVCWLLVGLVGAVWAVD